MCNNVVRLTSYCHALQGKNLPSAADFRNTSEKFNIKELNEFLQFEQVSKC